MENKTCKVVTNPCIARALLKQNSNVQKKYCPYCGKPVTEGCACPQDNVIIDIKRNKNNNAATVFCFANTPEFAKAFEALEAQYTETSAEPVV